ncbi:MAG: cyclically-permuted mutarotase family protein [Rikenellaceae bacterium]
MRLKLILTMLIGLLTTGLATGKKYENNFVWSEVASLPSAEGMASPYGGTSNGAIIVAGGCNFPEEAVWDGGAKRFYSDIFVLPANSTEWISSSTLPYEVAYGASVDTPKGVLCIGGQNNEGKLDAVTLLTWDAAKSQLTKTQYPSLPFALTTCDAAVTGGYVYVAGGATDGQNSGTHFLRLSLKDGAQWEVLPDFPGEGRAKPALVAQNGAESVNLYLFGGSDFPVDNQMPSVVTTAYKYNTSSMKWSAISDCTPVKGELQSLHDADALAVGKSHILFFGGVNYEIFLDAVMREYELKYTDSQEVKDAFAQWQQEYFAHDEAWYKFSRDVVVYNTLTDTWSIGDEYPYRGVAGAKVIPYGQGWAVINGEVKPGVRTNEVYYGYLNTQPPFGLINWAVLILYLLGMLYMGYYFMSKSKSTDDFFKGGGRIPWWAVGISLFATMLSAITFMAVPAKTFATDWRYFPMAVTILVMVLPVIRYYLPFFRRLNVTTAYEYLEKRFSYAVRLLASSLFIVFMVARMALTLFLPSLALTTVTGIDIYLCIVLMGLVTLAYCTMGGVEAVIWSDVVQGIILVGGALLTLVFLVSNIPGGLNEMMTITMDNEKFKMFDFSFSLTSGTFWVIIIGGLANNLISYTSDQTVIQRYITTKSEKAAGNSILLNGFLSVIVSVVFYSIGTALYAFYKTHPTNLNFEMMNTDSIFPHFIMAEMPVGLAGLLIAAIFAATMSTVSSNVNSLSTAFTVDIYRRLDSKADDKKQLNVARLSSVCFGIVGIMFAVLMASWNILSLFDYFNYLLGLLSSSVAALFVIGIFLPRVGTPAALIGFILGNIAILSVSIYTDLSFWLYGFLGIFFTVGGAYIASLFVKNHKDIDGVTWKTLKRE